MKARSKALPEPVRGSMKRENKISEKLPIKKFKLFELWTYLAVENTTSQSEAPNSLVSDKKNSKLRPA